MMFVKPEKLDLQAPAKLNLFLHVIGRQMGGKHDGYHLLQSIFTLLDFGDTITLETRADTGVSRVSALAGVPPEKDLVVRAALLLQTHAGCNTGRNRGCNISVEKRIPMGGGLGGGSSDAATVLLGLNRLWNLNLPNAELQRLSLSLGADVPFFINGQNAFSEGIGEVLTPIAVPNWWYLVLTPPETVPTPAIFSSPELTRDSISLKIADFSANGLINLLRQCRNDLQPVVLKAFPVVAAHFEALQTVSAQSIFGARLTGSGACVFAAFEFEHDARDAFLHLSPKVQGFVAQGMNCHPHV